MSVSKLLKWSPSQLIRIHRHKTPEIRTTLVLAGLVTTRLFATVAMPSSWIHKFFTPPLPPHTVVKAIIQALDAQESRTIHMPFYTHFVRYTTIMPSFVRDCFQWVGWFLRSSVAKCLSCRGNHRYRVPTMPCVILSSFREGENRKERYHQRSVWWRRLVEIRICA